MSNHKQVTKHVSSKLEQAIELLEDLQAYLTDKGYETEADNTYSPIVDNLWDLIENIDDLEPDK